MTPQVTFASDHSLLIVLGGGISRDQQRMVAQLCRLIESDGLEAIRNLHPAYGSVLITFDPRRMPPESVERSAQAWLGRLGSLEPPPARRVEIPVCYGSGFGPDLADVAGHTHLSREDVIRIHSSTEYFVYFLGFSPGFPYLGELPEALHAPRLPSPRTRVPAGSVAIGGTQTGVYPLESPGGWRIIGRTPLALFDARKARPALLSMGDLVRFRPISEEEFARTAEVRR
jgi:KipI family sensor histidine kinase inhibitor